MVTKKTQSRKIRKPAVAKVAPTKSTVIKTPEIRQVINKRVEDVKKITPTPKVEFIPAEPVDVKVDIVEKPVDVKREAKIEAMNAPKLPKEVVHLNRILDEYVGLSKQYPTEKVLEKKISSFSRIMLFALNKPIPSVLNRMLDFFTIERHLVMSEYNAMNFISKLTYAEREKYATFYTVLLGLIDFKIKKRPFTFSRNAIARILNNDDIMNFIALTLEG